MKSYFTYIGNEYYSNCFIEAIKAKIKNPSVVIYFCKPRMCDNGKFQSCHFMWTDGCADYDFSDDEAYQLPWYRCFVFKGRIRKFKPGFAKKYSEMRNRSKKTIKNRQGKDNVRGEVGR